MANSLNWRGTTPFAIGDTIKVSQTIVEGEKTRIQSFEGLVIRIHGHQNLKSFTVRKIGANGIGVEKIFPELTPTVTAIEVKKQGKVRRAVLSYLKTRLGKKATKVKDVFVKGVSQASTDDILIKAKTEAPLDKEEPAKNKTAKRPKEEKEKKVKKGPKKIVRKERHFTR